MQANVNTEHMHRYQRLQQANLAQNMLFTGLRNSSSSFASVDNNTGNYDEGSQVMADVPTKFDSAYAPAVSLVQYLSRIHTYAKCSDSCFVVALIYIDRIIDMHSFRVTALNVHRIFLASILLSVKFLDDIYYNNSFFAKLGGIPLQELNALEVEFLRLTRFDLNVSEQQYGAYHASIRAYVRRTPAPQLLTLNRNEGLFSRNNVSSISSMANASTSSMSGMACGSEYLMSEMDLQWQQQTQQVVLGAYVYTSPVPLQANHVYVHVVTPPRNTAQAYGRDGVSVPDMYSGNSNVAMLHCIGYDDLVDGTLDANANYVQDRGSAHELQPQEQLQPTQQQKQQQLLPNGLQAQQWWEEGEGGGQGQQMSHTDGCSQPASFPHPRWLNHYGAGAGYGYSDPTCIYPVLPHMYPMWRMAVPATI